MIRTQMTSFLLGLLMATALQSAAAHASDTILYAFKGKGDGATPDGNLVRDSSGNLYGTTAIGGKSGCHFISTTCGVVFKLTSAGTESVLYKFKGSSPVGGLVSDNSGNFYGVTVEGGLSESGCGNGCGTVFELAPSGKETQLYAFTGQKDGVGPAGGVLLDSSGNLYGTTLDGGGTSRCGGESAGCGILFSLAAKGSETILHTFAGGADGAHPTGRLLMDSSNNLYGLTGTGGSSDTCGTSWNGCGAVFKLTSSGTESILHAFAGGSDGAYPVAGLSEDSSGNLYGTTVAGGSYPDDCGVGIDEGCGTVYRLAPNGTEAILHVFAGGSDGAYPFAGLIMDSSGNIFGETMAGGSKTSCGTTRLKRGSGCGVVFEITSAGKESILYAFKGSAKNDGAYPFAGLILDSSGNLYGVTFGGGTKGCDSHTFGKTGCGTVFKLAR
jgi:uncharacterized repeat protein (TIGR03803 family)